MEADMLQFEEDLSGALATGAFLWAVLFVLATTTATLF